MQTPLLDRMRRRQKANRLDIIQRMAMMVFIGSVIVIATFELIKAMVG